MLLGINNNKWVVPEAEEELVTLDLIITLLSPPVPVLVAVATQGLITTLLQHHSSKNKSYNVLLP